MGYLIHSYKENNLFQAVIGNTIIAIAPFFGGAAAIFLLVYLLLPEFSLYSSEAPQLYYITSENLLFWKSYLLFGQTVLDFFSYLVLNFFNETRLIDLKFYIFLFIQFGIAGHLSPSANDFKNFWQPFAVIFLFTTLLNLIILPLTKNSQTVITTASKYIFLATPILLLAIFVGVLGLVITYAIYLLLAIFRR